MSDRQIPTTRRRLALVAHDNKKTGPARVGAVQP